MKLRSPHSMSSSEQFLGKIFRNDDIYGGGEAYLSNESFAFLLDPLYQTLKPVKVGSVHRAMKRLNS